MPDVSVKITGLRELGKAFKQMDSELGKEMKVGFKGLAERIAGLVRGGLPGNAGRFIKSSGTQRGAGISFPGGEDTGRGDFLPWLMFGGSTGKGHQVGKPWSGSVKRPLVKDGGVLYQTIKAHREDIEQEAGDLMERLATKAGFDLSG